MSAHSPIPTPTHYRPHRTASLHKNHAGIPVRGICNFRSTNRPYHFSVPKPHLRTAPPTTTPMPEVVWDPRLSPLPLFFFFLEVGRKKGGHNSGQYGTCAYIHMEHNWSYTCIIMSLPHTDLVNIYTCNYTCTMVVKN